MSGKWTEKEVLVTGGMGFIGSHLVDLLVAEGATVTVVDLKVHGDVRDSDEMQKAVEGKDIVFHLAANADVPHSVLYPRHDFETNIVGTFNVLKSCIGTNVERVIYASSAAVYGEPEYIPIDLHHPLNPISPYGASKLAGEKLGFAYYHTYGLPFISLRIFNTYGPRQQRYVMLDFLKKLKGNPKKLEVLGTGEQIRDYCYITDMLTAFILSAESKNAVGEVFNVSGGSVLSIKQLAEIVVELAGTKGTTDISYTGKTGAGDISELVAETTRTKDMLNFKPKVKLEEGLLKLKRWFDGV